MRKLFAYGKLLVVLLMRSGPEEMPAIYHLSCGKAAHASGPRLAEIDDGHSFVFAGQF